MILFTQFNEVGGELLLGLVLPRMLNTSAVESSWSVISCSGHCPRMLCKQSFHGLLLTGSYNFDLAGVSRC